MTNNAREFETPKEPALNPALNPALPPLAAPSYLDQSPQVRARFAQIQQREVILEVRNLDKRFTTQQRELVCVIGASGCGKSTLIRILAGLEKQSAGDVLLDGAPIQGPGRDRGMVFQGYSLFPWLSVKRNVMFGPEMSGRSRDEAESAARLWLEMVGLTAFADSYPHQLSGGMRQRVAIARALVNEPRILLMDEPFGALDAQTRSRMQKHLLEIWKNIDVTILFITHDLDEAIYLADRILVLKPHPGEVREIIEVPVPRPRSAEQINSPEFRATKARLEALIHPPAADQDAAQQAVEAELPEPSMVRFTRADDNVENR